MYTKFLTIATLILLTTLNCNKKSEPQIICDKQVILDADAFINGPADLLNFNSIEIDQNCLKINFSSSGCDGSTWQLKLLDSEEVLYSDPPQRNIRLSLKNDEPCDAYFSKKISFDIHDLQVDGDKVILNMNDWSDPIIYQY